jgi:hypothetical protein
MMEERMEPLRRFLSRSSGKQRMDEQRVLTGGFPSIAAVCSCVTTQGGMVRPRRPQPQDAMGMSFGEPPVRAPPPMGAFADAFESGTSERAEEKPVMIGVSGHGPSARANQFDVFKAHCAATSLRARKGADDGRGGLIGPRGAIRMRSGSAPPMVTVLRSGFSCLQVLAAPQHCGGATTQFAARLSAIIHADQRAAHGLTSCPAG